MSRDLRSLEYIHGGLDQGKRISIFMRFKEKKIKYMVATDVAGRGLDFSHVSHVINYDFPFNSEIYTHRTGRTGRMGRTGIALTLVSDRDLGSLKEILRKNAIEPQWQGQKPDLESVSRRGGRPRNRRQGQGDSGQGRRGGRSRGRGPSKHKPAAA